MGREAHGEKRYHTIDAFESTLHLTLNDEETFQRNRRTTYQAKPLGMSLENQQQVEMQQKAEGQNKSTYKYPFYRSERNVEIKEAAQIQNIRKALIRSLGVGIFKPNDENITWTGFDKREPQKLHHSRGTKLLKEGNNVLEFDMAGSGFQGFTQQHHGLKGKTNDSKEKIDMSDAEVEIEWGLRYGEKISVKNKTRQFVRQKSRKSKDKSAEKRRITMAGPVGAAAFWGAFNGGEYKIENLREYMLELGKEYILEKLPGALNMEEKCKKMKEEGKDDEYVQEYCEEWKKWHKYKPITMVLRGHSRGGVAMAHGAMMIQYWINENLPMLKDLIRFETIQYDPVPGPHLDEEKTRISLVGGTEKEKEQLAKKKMAPLNESANTTVVYSMDTQYGNLDLFVPGGSFTPQIVKGVKRLILSPYNHSVSLRNVDSSQGEKKDKNKEKDKDKDKNKNKEKDKDKNKNKDKDKDAHRAGYTYAKKDASGKIKADFYRSSGLNELDEGVFVADEDGILKKMDTCDDVMRFLDLVYKESGDKRQWRRHDAIREAVKAWFDQHKE